MKDFLMVVVARRCILALFLVVTVGMMAGEADHACDRDAKIIKAAQHTGTATAQLVAMLSALLDIKAENVRQKDAPEDDPTQVIISYLKKPPRHELVYSIAQYPEAYRAVAFHPETLLLAAASHAKNNHVTLWNLATPQKPLFVNQISNNAYSESIAFSQTGRRFLYDMIGDSSAISIWNLHAEQRSVTLRSTLKHKRSAKFIGVSDSKKAVFVGNDGIEFFDTDTGERRLFIMAKRTILHPTMSRDGTTIAFNDRQGIINCWDDRTRSLAPVTIKQRNDIGCLQLNYTGKLLAIGGLGGSVELLSLAEKSLARLQGNHADYGASHGISALSFNQKGPYKLLAAASGDHIITVWNIETGLCLQRLNGHSDRISSIDFSSDGYLLASGSYDKTIKVWQLSPSLEEVLRGPLSKKLTERQSKAARQPE